MTGWKDENGVFVVGMNLQNQGYDLTWPTGFFEEMNTFSFDESSSSLSMEGYNAGELEVQLLDLLDAYKEQKMQRLSFDRAVSLVRNLGGMKFEENVNSAKLSLNDDEQSYTADTLSVDLKFAALGEPEGRVGTGFSLAATNVTVSDNALSALQGLDLGAFLKPKTLRFAFGTAHQPLEAYDALSDDDATLAQGFAHLWKEVAPTVFGNFEWSNDDLIMSVRLKGDLEFEVEQDNAEAMDAHGNLEVIVIGLDALTEKLAGLSSENMTQESKELLFWLRAGLGVLSTYAKADENDSTLIDIRFGNKEDLNVNGHKLPFKTNEPFFN